MARLFQGLHALQIVTSRTLAVNFKKVGGINCPSALYSVYPHGGAANRYLQARASLLLRGVAHLGVVFIALRDALLCESVMRPTLRMSKRLPSAPHEILGAGLAFAPSGLL